MRPSGFVFMLILASVFVIGFQMFATNLASSYNQTALSDVKWFNSTSEVIGITENITKTFNETRKEGLIGTILDIGGSFADVVILPIEAVKLIFAMVNDLVTSDVLGIPDELFNPLLAIPTMAFIFAVVSAYLRKEV